MTDNKTIANGIITKTKTRNRFRGDIKSSVSHKTPCFSGLNDLKGNVQVGYNPDYPLHQVSYKNAFSSALEAVVEHEITHEEDRNGNGCPKIEQLSIDHILIPVSKVLKKKGIPNVPIGSQGHTTYSYFGNLFTDFVVNNIGSRNIGSRGYFLLYDDQAQYSGGLGELFEGFTKLQAMTFPKKEGVSLLIKHFKQTEKPKEAVKNFLARTHLMDMQKDERVNYLADSKNWKELSTVFADEFSKLLDLKNLQACYFPVFGGNDFLGLDNEETQMDIVLRAYQSSEGAFEPPEFMDENLALLALYRQFARKIEMKVNSHSFETERPVAHVSRRPFDFQKDTLDRLEFGVNHKGRLEAQIGKYPLNVKSRYQVTAGTFPEIRFGLVDCSSSTQESLTGQTGRVMNPWAPQERQWTDASIYHYEIGQAFGLLELFRRRGTLKSANVKVGVFSDSARIGSDLGESEKILLRPDFRGTSLSKNTIRVMFEGRDSLVYTISDGGINNWSKIRDEFIEGAKKHNYFHLQVSRRGETLPKMYDELKEAGLTAVHDDGSDSRILIDLTQNQIYGAK